MKNKDQTISPQPSPEEMLFAQTDDTLLLESITGEEVSANLKPMDDINGYKVRPGFYEVNGASALPGGVNFTIASHNATSCELLLFHRKSSQPFASIPFPEHYRIGNVFSMIVFGLKIDEFEYAYRLDGPYDPEKGLIFDKNKYILDPYAKAVTGQSEWGVHLPCERNCQYKSRVVRNNFDWGSC